MHYHTTSRFITVTLFVKKFLCRGSKTITREQNGHVWITGWYKLNILATIIVPTSTCIPNNQTNLQYVKLLTYINSYSMWVSISEKLSNSSRIQTCMQMISFKRQHIQIPHTQNFLTIIYTHPQQYISEAEMVHKLAAHLSLTYTPQKKEEEERRENSIRNPLHRQQNATDPMHQKKKGKATSTNACTRTKMNASGNSSYQAPKD